MSDQAELLKLECTLALARFLLQDPQVRDLHTFGCSMFFAGIDCMEKPPRSVAEVEEELAAARAQKPPVPKPARRKPDYSKCF